jgi:4-hydroxybenzoyl-CoA thioesterase/acyl-CoA thioester hydrolase
LLDGFRVRPCSLTPGTGIELKLTPAIFELPIRVYIEDTDAQGIVYYVNYLKYMERARSEWLRSFGFENPAFWGERLIFVVHSLSASYKKPARLDDQIVATAQGADYGRVFFTVKQTVRRGEDMLCTGEVKVACVDRTTMRPVAVPRQMIERVFER